MTAERLTLAIEAGWLPDAGRILCLGARAEDLPLGLDPGRVQVVQTFKPEADALARAGYDTALAPSGTFAAALVHTARARDLSRDRVARARAAVPEGPILVDGAKTDGVESLLSAVRKQAEVAGVLSKAHGKIFRIPGGDFADWQCPPALNADGFQTAPGVFSAPGIDAGSALLAAALPSDLRGDVADFGAGWGFLSREALRRPGVTALHLVEADHSALACAKTNIGDPRAQFHWADATRWTAPSLLAHILCNPPFHVGRTADPSLGQAFLTAAAQNLAPRGTLWLVANRHLPYESALTRLFGQVTDLGGDAGFKLLAAERPRRARQAG